MIGDRAWFKTRAHRPPRIRSMPRRTARPQPTRELELTTSTRRCPGCDGPLWAASKNRRTVITLDGVLRLGVQVRRCRKADCPRFRAPLRPEQEELFYSLAPKMFGDAVLVSHAIVSQWDRDCPMTLSAAGIGRLRKRLPDTLLITDDMQMQGLQKALGTRQACLKSLKAGIDMVCIGNNLFDQEQEIAGIASSVSEGLRDGALSAAAIERSIARIVRRKALVAAAG